MFEKYKKLLTQYVAFKSISTDEAYKPEMLKTANWLMELLGSFGFKTKLLKGKFCNPIIFRFRQSSKKLVHSYRDMFANYPDLVQFPESIGVARQ